MHIGLKLLKVICMILLGSTVGLGIMSIILLVLGVIFVVAAICFGILTLVVFVMELVKTPCSSLRNMFIRTQS